MRRFRFLAEKCTACGACAVACMDENDFDAETGEKPFRIVTRREEKGVSLYASDACRHCDEPACAGACPMECLYRDEATGLVLFDTASCVGCGACRNACPFDAIGMYGQPPRMGKCHGCFPRVTAGLPPACVKACPAGALLWEEP